MVGWLLLVGLLLGVIGSLSFYVIKLAKIIFMFEDDLAETIQVHERSMTTFDKILKMPLFFDSPEVRSVLTEALEDIKMCKLATQKVITNFTRRSKQKYIRVENVKEASE